MKNNQFLKTGLIPVFIEGFLELKIPKILKFPLQQLKNKIVKYHFDNSLMNKKENLKLQLYSFTKDLYIYCGFKTISEKDKELIEKYITNTQGIDKHNLPKNGITKKERLEYLDKLYINYIEIINKSLIFNKEFISLSRLDYFKKIQFDLLNTDSINPRTNFIYQNDFKHIDKLKAILEHIYNFSKRDDYFTELEFKEFMVKYKDNFNIEDIDIFKNLNKIPKRLKRRIK